MLKRFGIVLTVGLAFASHAQTTNPPPATPMATNVFQLLGVQSWGNVLQTALVDATPYISNKIVSVEAGGLYNAALPHSKFGGFMDISVPTGTQSGIGIGAAYIGGHFLDANVNFQLGTTATLPVIGAVYAFVSDGPDYDFYEKGVGNYSFAGFEKKFDISQTFTLTVGGGVGNISTLPGTEKAFGLSITKHF